MPIALLLLLVNVGLAVHAAKTGRFSPWGWIIVLLPPLGGIAYILVELLPNLLGSPRGERTRRAIAHSVNPERIYRALRDQLAEADTVANRARFAEECAALGKWQEAWEQYDEIVQRPNGGEPVFHLARAEADLALGRPAEALAGLDALKVREPDYDSPRGPMLHARALAAVGRTEEAIDAFETISRHDHAYEARARLASVLAEAGRPEEARRDAQEILDSLRRAPAHVRKLQAEWGRLAENVLRRT
ncbi:tetratricopeptide repeat protein [Methylobacterium sp. SyP6R]|uniref:tetratricopeptide repeat protein n=1 Tax=Methylobacterium sp. SyP6R TaxID=2718876 RepID=UPI001F226763|nr:tetratricopeptide repeat protein [Methylobacterium sp. SyP6R]MCF4128948.1 tetratricopeptide repeat protein [Methylobacterium sp. SyP6R]